MRAPAAAGKKAAGKTATGKTAAGKTATGRATTGRATLGKTTSGKAPAGKPATVKATTPQRVQLKRSAGWKMPANTLKVDRTTRWGNPFTIADCGSAAIAVAQHGRWMRGEIVAPGGVEPRSRDLLRSELGGRNLACWCAPNGPCHADLLLALANSR